MKNYSIKGHTKTKVRSNSKVLKKMGILMMLYRIDRTCHIKND